MRTAAWITVPLAVERNASKVSDAWQFNGVPIDERYREEMTDALRKAVDKEIRNSDRYRPTYSSAPTRGAGRLLAQRFHVTRLGLNEMLEGTRPLSMSIARALGYRPVVVFLKDGEL